jgi:uncharacterized protein (DUF427 family)
LRAMSTRLRDVLMARLEELRHEPIDKRIRATLGDATVIDSIHALLVWEAKRVVPTYAVPEADIAAEVVATDATTTMDASQFGVAAMGAPQLLGRPVFDPSVPFAVRVTPGTDVMIRAGDREAAAFRPDDEALAGYVIVDFAAFDAWYEEDERNLGHPRDPFHRIDIVHSSRHVRVERDGVLLAESSNPCLLFEPPLPVRYYLPPADVRTELLRPSDTRTICAYKGEASYLSLDGEDDVAWTYRAPLREAREVTDRVCFFNELVDVVVDGTALERPVTPWSRR